MLKNKRILKQIFDFALVGVLATVIDYLTFVVVYNFIGWHYNVATVIAFIIATVFNYRASMAYVFESRFAADQRHKEFVLFLILSIVGLGLNVILMRFTVENLGIIPNLAKIIVTGLVMIFNFVTRKGLLEAK